MNKYLEKIAETSGKTSFDVDTSYKSNSDDESKMKSYYDHFSKKSSTVKDGGLFVRSSAGDYHYHPKTGLRKLNNVKVSE